MTLTMGNTEDREFCQQLAEALWLAATSENHEIAAYDSPVYRHLGNAFVSAVRITYGLSEMKARRVRALLAEYGPHDSLTGTSGWGIDSYAQFADENSANDYSYVS